MAKKSKLPPMHAPIRAKIAMATTLLLAAGLACSSVGELSGVLAATPTTAATRTSGPAQPTPTFIAPDNPFPGAEGLGDPYFADLGNGGYDVQHYSIALAIDVEGNQIAGTTTIEALSTQELTSLNLEFVGLEISAISVNGAESLFERDGAELTIYLPQPAAADI